MIFSYMVCSRGERDVCDRLVILYAAGGGNKRGVGWEVFGEGLE